MSRPRRRAGNYADNEEEEDRSDPPFYETPTGQEDPEHQEDQEVPEHQEEQEDPEHQEDQEVPDDHDDDPGLPAGTPTGNQGNHNDLLPSDLPSTGAQDRARGPLSGVRSAPRVLLQREAARRGPPPRPPPTRSGVVSVRSSSVFPPDREQPSRRAHYGRAPYNYNDYNDYSEPDHPGRWQQRPSQGGYYQQDYQQKQEGSYGGYSNRNQSTWKSVTSREQVGKVIKEVEWTPQVLGHPWSSEDDEVGLSEFKSKFTKAPSYVWSDPRWRYFLLRHNLSIDLQRLLDCYDEDHPVDEAQYSDPYDAQSDYWVARTAHAWDFLESTYSGADGDHLEDKWNSVWLEKGTTFLKFWSRFESLSREVARSRHVPKLSEQELRCRMYSGMPAKCRSYLDERGYKQAGVMNYKALVDSIKAWCSVHWDSKHMTVNSIDQANLPTSTVTPAANPSASPIYDSTMLKTSTDPLKPTATKPKIKRTRDDSAILNDPVNKLIISAKCGRCLTGDGHSAPTCCDNCVGNVPLA